MGSCRVLCRAGLVLAGSIKASLCAGCGYRSISSLRMKGGMQIVSANLVLAGHSQPAVSLTSTSQGSVFSPVWRGREQVRREGKKAEGGEKELYVGS